MCNFKNINILDCTLRDGGHVNNAKFGKDTIKGIIKYLNEAGTNIIELGFLKNGNFDENESNYNKIEEVYSFLPNKSISEYSLMIRPDWYDIRQLSPCNGKINFLRFAFYYKDIELVKKYCKIARELGYKFFLNPVNMPGYTPKELKQLVKDIKEINPYAVTIVDTYGSLMEKELSQIYEYLDTTLNDDIIIDLHLHENLNLSFALARYFLQIKNDKRKIFLDASLYGMGRVPGNLCIEAIMDYVNSCYNLNYDISKILKAIGEYILPIRKEYFWGYSPAYYWTAKLKLHRSYAEYFVSQTDIKLEDIQKLLIEVKKNSKDNNFDKNLAEEISKKQKEGKYEENNICSNSCQSK